MYVNTLASYPGLSIQIFRSCGKKSFHGRKIRMAHKVRLLFLVWRVFVEPGNEATGLLYLKISYLVSDLLSVISLRSPSTTTMLLFLPYSHVHV